MKETYVDDLFEALSSLVNARDARPSDELDRIVSDLMDLISDEMTKEE